MGKFMGIFFYFTSLALDHFVYLTVPGVPISGDNAQESR